MPDKLCCNASMQLTVVFLGLNFLQAEFCLSKAFGESGKSTVSSLRMRPDNLIAGMPTSDQPGATGPGEPDKQVPNPPAPSVQNNEIPKLKLSNEQVSQPMFMTINHNGPTTTVAFAGDWTNTSDLKLFTSDPDTKNLVISASGNIFLPAGSKIDAKDLSLVLKANKGIYNAGSIKSSSLSLESPIVANVGHAITGSSTATIEACSGKVAITTEQLLNQGQIEASADIDIAAQSGSNIAINGEEGLFKTIKGSIIVSSKNKDGSNIDIQAGDWQSPFVSLNAGKVGKVNAEFDSVTGKVKSTGASSVVNSKKGKVQFCK